MSPDTIGTTIISPTYRFSLSYWPPTMTSSIRTLSRYGLMIPRKLVTRIAASTTPTWSRYGPKNATIRRTVRARRSGGTRSKSLLGGVRRPGPALPLARARTPPPRKLIDPNLAPIRAPGHDGGMSVAAASSAAWLLDPAYPTVRRLARSRLGLVDDGPEPPAIADEPWIQALVTLPRTPLHPYAKWAGVHWRLGSLAELDADPASPAVAAVVE